VHGELALIGAPVYAGRIPPDAVRRLRRLRAKDTPAAVVVVYGNRAYEDALIELRDLALEAGFVPVAGGAFIGEHSFSTEVMPIAHGRPDAQDLIEAAAFGRQIRAKLAGLYALDDLPLLHVPGNVPYQDRGGPAQISPETQGALCPLCGTCATVCPTAAIALDDAVETDPEACILCCACVKNCPTGARVLTDPRVVKLGRWLYADYRERKAPETYV
jgi:ferredoxin